jgi:hypothetical protein
MNNTIISEGVLAPGANTIVTVSNPNSGASISFIRVTSTSVNTVTLELVRASGTKKIYSFTLAAGDVLTDSTPYGLKNGDSLVITTTAASTDYEVYGYIS